MELIKSFSQLNKNDVSIAGGKGASLGEMTQAGINVPQGFVILSSAFEQFLEENELIAQIDSILHSVDIEKMHTVENASEEIHSLILNAKISKKIEKEILEHFKKLGAKFVAVRSSATAEDSATAAWAGQLDTFLNTTQKDVLENVKKCWASLFSPRAIFYRVEKNLHNQKISVAVVVQKMIESEFSGIAFSVHPVTQDRNQLIIEAGFGLGEAIVSGQITPDSFVVEKNNWEIIEKHVSEQTKKLIRGKNGNEWVELSSSEASKQKLSDKEIIQLSKLIIKIEKHYGFPVDVEWTKEKNKFFILQSRPITTLTNEQSQTKQIFVKAYTRNFSIIMQEAWFAANKQNLMKKLGLKEYPFDPPYIYFMKEGVEEVWENTKANQWLIDKLIEKINSDKKFFPQVYERYFQRLNKVEKFWKKNIDNLKELKEFIKLVYDGISDFVIIYGILNDKRVSKKYHELATKFREKDVFFADSNAAIQRSLNKIFPDLGYLSVYITFEELGRKISKQELMKRDKGFALLPGIFQGTISFQELMEKFPEYNFEIEQVDESKNILNGQTAFNGKVSGIVRIVKRLDQAQQVINGEIIVSPMTTPDFVPFIKKASAFITDEGGITCHAAIVARELKKPCIIGTKIATEVLKDGDLVEVDANKGIVKILSKSGKISLNAEDFIPAFEAKGITLLFADIIMQTYGKIGVVHVFSNEMFQQFVLKTDWNKNLEEGLIIYNSKQKFNEFEKRIKKVFNNAEKAFPKIIRNPTNNLTKAFFNLSIKNIDAYSRMDPFFTDKAFIQSKSNKIIEKNLDTIKKTKDIYRADINKFFIEKDNFLQKLLEKLSKQFKVPIDELWWYLIQDIENLFIQKKLSSNEIKQRKLAYFQIEENNQIKNFSGEEAIKIIEQIKKIPKISKEIHGIVANKSNNAIIRATAKVISVDYGNIKAMHSQIKEMKKGQILVAQTTAPELMEACKKASAIITDIGGMLSHAAIVSRELEIPCIVQTHYATKIIQNNDLIEINANNGIIKILKKTE